MPLPESGSPAVKDFLSHCFRKDPKARATAKELLNHPWIVRSQRQMENMNTVQAVASDTLQGQEIGQGQRLDLREGGEKNHIHDLRMIRTCVFPRCLFTFMSESSLPSFSITIRYDYRHGVLQSSDILHSLRYIFQIRKSCQNCCPFLPIGTML
jgi:serine/threonine protein kinase